MEEKTEEREKTKEKRERENIINKRERRKEMSCRMPWRRRRRS